MLDLGINQASPSSRRAWIEILRRASGGHRPYVALLAEGVDRNCVNYGAASSYYVALLAEGVDRNRAMSGSPKEDIESPSSRRAWIEI